MKPKRLLCILVAMLVTATTTIASAASQGAVAAEVRRAEALAEATRKANAITQVHIQVEQANVAILARDKKLRKWAEAIGDRASKARQLSAASSDPAQKAHYNRMALEDEIQLRTELVSRMRSTHPHLAPAAEAMLQDMKRHAHEIGASGTQGAASLGNSSPPPLRRSGQGQTGGGVDRAKPNSDTVEKIPQANQR